MKICIDISQIPYGTGVSVYTKNLVKNLLKIDKDNEYVLFAGYLRRKQDFLDFFSDINQKNVKLKLIPFFSPSVADLLWNRLHVFKVERFVGKIDIYHSSDWAQAPSNAKTVTTVHDLAPILLPKQTPKKVVTVHKRRLYRVKKVDCIIVPSESSKNDLVSLGFKKKSISVIPEAASLKFQRLQPSKVSAVLKKYRIEGKYLLTVGTNPRKNLPRIFEAFDKVKVKNKLSKLVVVGENKHQHHRNGVIYTGRVSTSDLVSLYNGAECLVYASLYEGFGLPILEAFSCSCPVVTSKNSSMADVADNACVLVDPESIDDISGGINKLLDQRSEFVLKGKKRVKKFNWINTSSQTLEIYNKLSK